MLKGHWQGPEVPRFCPRHLNQLTPSQHWLPHFTISDLPGAPWWACRMELRGRPLFLMPRCCSPKTWPYITQEEMRQTSRGKKVETEQRRVGDKRERKKTEISTFTCVGMSSPILQMTEKVRHAVCHGKSTALKTWKLIFFRLFTWPR